MGIVNVTPDSFSDGGRWADPAGAVAHGLRLSEAGADIVDVGGESTRPGAQRVDERAEQERVLPVVAALAAAGVAVSIDTMRAGTAQAAVAAGACAVNDVSGGLADPQMHAAVAGTGAAYIAMHWRAHSRRMHQWAHYSADPVADVLGELDERVAAAVAAGIDPSRLVVDPGLGFAKEAEHNWALLAGLDRFVRMGPPVLVGASRKRFLGALLADADQPRPVDRRDAATDAITALAAAAGVWAVRVHSVAGSADAVRVAAALQRAANGAAPSPALTREAP
jgi:dihydropteroate synthase